MAVASVVVHGWVHMGSADDIAAAVGFLSSEEAAFITGQVLGVNGGSVM